MHQIGDREARSGRKGAHAARFRCAGVSGRSGRVGLGWVGSGRVGSDRIESDRAGSDRAGSGWSDRAGSGWSDRAGSDRAGLNRAVPDRAESRLAGSVRQNVSARRQAASFDSKDAAAWAGLVDGRST
ncbi:MAG: hypothetical protein E2591_14755 [Achromobacter sp.]|nr:hypothetical protein [Achromobacter sp.]